MEGQGRIQGMPLQKYVMCNSPTDFFAHSERSCHCAKLQAQFIVGYAKVFSFRVAFLCSRLPWELLPPPHRTLFPPTIYGSAPVEA